MRIASACVVATVAAGILACGGGGADRVTDAGNNGGECKAPSSVPAGATVVLIKDFNFVPERATVARGGQVAWVNCGKSGEESHTSTSDAGIWDSPSIVPGAVFIRTFDAAAGTSFDYHCVPHPFMKGTVTVN
jgi:plastocyanin